MIARKSLLPMANVAVGALLGVLALKVTAVYFGREAYGQFEVAFAYLGILYLFADLSMDAAHVKRVSEGMDAGDCFVTFAVFRSVASLVFMLVSLGGFVLYTVVLHRTVEDTTVVALLLCMAYYVAKSMPGVAQSTLDAKLQTARSQMGALVETVVRVGLVAMS